MEGNSGVEVVGFSQNTNAKSEVKCKIQYFKVAFGLEVNVFSVRRF